MSAGSAYQCAVRSHWILFRLLAGKAVCAEDLCERFGVTQQTASRYLRMMADRYDLEAFRADARKYWKWGGLKVDVVAKYRADGYSDSEQKLAVDRLQDSEPNDGDP